MDFTQLKTFRLVAATGSFTEAAAALHYVQSSVTAHIQALEGDLGVQLFQRLSRRVVLTPAGARLLRSADTWLQQVEQARQAVRAPEAAVGPFTLSAPDTLSVHWLPAVFREFRSAHPELRMVFRPAPRTTAWPWPDRFRPRICGTSRCSWEPRPGFNHAWVTAGPDGTARRESGRTLADVQPRAAIQR